MNSTKRVNPESMRSERVIPYRARIQLLDKRQISMLGTDDDEVRRGADVKSAEVPSVTCMATRSL